VFLIDFVIRVQSTHCHPKKRSVYSTLVIPRSEATRNLLLPTSADPYPSLDSLSRFNSASSAFVAAPQFPQPPAPPDEALLNSGLAARFLPEPSLQSSARAPDRREESQ